MYKIKYFIFVKLETVDQSEIALYLDIPFPLIQSEFPLSVCCKKKYCSEKNIYNKYANCIKGVIMKLPVSGNLINLNQSNELRKEEKERE